MSRTEGRPGPARRAVVRWAWRLFRREWRQQLLVLALVTVAVSGAVALAAIAVKSASSGDARFGDARALTELDATDPGRADAGVEQARARYGEVEVIGHTPVSVPGVASPLDLRAQANEGVFSRPTLALRSGRFPSGSGEMAVTPDLASLLGVGIGDVADLGGVERTVVGLIENPSDLEDDFALVVPGAAVPVTLTVLFDDTTPRGPAPASQRQAEVRFAIESRGTNGPVAAIVLVATTLAMALVALVAASGFVVVAQRRQRQLGMLAAIGATERHLRLVMLATGAITGTVAAVAGIAMGTVGWIAVAPAVEAAANHRIERLDLPWALIAQCGVLAIAMTTAAAWWPARTLARLPVMAALSGRPSAPRSVNRSSALALVLVSLGAGGIAAARPTGNVRPLVLIAGMAAAVVGVVFAAPAAIRSLAVPATRLPFAPRLALRDLVRYQARAAAALAAITVAVGISVAVVGVAKANEYRSDEGNLSDRQLLIRAGDRRMAPDPSLGDAERAALDRGARAVAAAVGHASVITLDVAMNPLVADEVGQREPVTEVLRENENFFRFVAHPYVATPQLLERYDIDPATIDVDADLLTATPGDVLLADFTAEKGRPGHSSVQRVELSSYTSAPRSLVTEGALSRNGWVRARAGWLVESDRPLAAEHVAAARAAAADAGLIIETRSGQDGLATLRTVATTAGGALALVIVAMTIGLIRSESARDLRTLTATGAGARTRRALSATTAGALAMLGVGLGGAVASVALAAGFHGDLSQLTPVPVANLGLLAVGTPLLAAGAGYLLAGREPRTFSRQVLE